MNENKTINSVLVECCRYCQSVKDNTLFCFGGGLIIVALHLILTAIYELIGILNIVRYPVSQFFSDGMRLAILSTFFYVIRFAVFTLSIISLALFFMKKVNFKTIYRIFIYSILINPLVRVLVYVWDDVFNYGMLSWRVMFDMLWYPVMVLCVSFLYLKHSKRIRMVFVR